MRIFIYECVTAGTLGRDVSDSLRCEGRAMLDAVVADFQRLPGVEVVTATNGHFADTAAKCDWTLVIAPEIDNHLRGLSQTVVDVGGRLLGSLPAGIALTADKLATAAFWRERGVSHPRTVRFDPETFAPPCVMKPRYGAGSQATFLIRNREDEKGVWAPAFHECPDSEFVVQPYMHGQAASVALLIGARQTIALMPARQHLSRDGRFRYQGGSLPLPAPLAERASRLALQAVAEIDGLQGYVGVDLVLGNDGGDFAIEINPRLTTSYIGLRQLCTPNLADLILRIVQGEHVQTPEWSTGYVRFAIDSGAPIP